MEHTSGEAESAERGSSTLERSSIMQKVVQEDDIADPSPFAVAEMWQLCPGLLQDYIIDHLDLRQAIRLTRVSTSWASEMLKILKRSKGIGALENWSTINLKKFTAAATAGGEEDASVLQLQMFLAIPMSGRVWHLILVKTVGEMKDASSEEWEVLTWMMPCLRKITLGGAVLYGNTNTTEVVQRSLLPFPIELVSFRNCKLELIFNFRLDTATKQVKRIFQAERDATQNGRRPILWGTTKIQVPGFGMRTDSCMEDYRENTKRIWRLLDSQGLLWPCPNQQSEWLLESLSNLNGDVLEAVKFVDRDWVNSLDSAQSRAALDKRDVSDHVTSKATSDGRTLNSLDLAFLAGLLIFSNKTEQITGQEPPPFPFPEGSVFAVRSIAFSSFY